MRTRRNLRRLAALGTLLGLSFVGGCAQQPPNQNSLSGIRLRVMMTFYQPINPAYYYFFLINKFGNTGSISAPGPVPVSSPVPGYTYGNGFATSSAQDKGGFTDFVLFSPNNASQYGQAPQQGFALYHVNGDVNVSTNFQPAGVPIAFTPPSTDTSSLASAQISFDIDLTQLIPNTTGQLSQSDLVNLAHMIQYLQVNIIATNKIPVDPQTAVDKEFDSIGNDLSTTTTFLTIPVTVNGTVQTRDYTDTNPGPSEPQNDIYPGGNGDESLDLKSWSISIINTGS